MKKLLSVFLAVCMLVALIVPCFMLPASAEITAPHPASVVYDFSDWNDHCMIQGDKYTNLASGVIGVNGDPALTLMPLKQGGNKDKPSFTWNHFAIPFVFEQDKEYVVSYDITMLSQLGQDTPAAKAKWTAFGTVTNEVSDGDVNPYKIPLKDKDGGDTLSWEVNSGEWTHVTGYIPKGTKTDKGEYKRNGWIETTDCLYFFEEAVDNNNYSSQIAIDNLIIMERNQFELTYADGNVPTRTDTPAVDMLAANWNNTRYMPVLATDCFSTNATSVLDSDGRMKWNFKANDNLFAAFNFQAGKTYHLSFDIALDPSHAEAYKNGVTLKAVAMDSSKGIAETTVEAFTGGITLPAGEWKRIEMTLTPANAHKFFGMVMETAIAEGVTTTVMWIDNFKLYVDGKEPACPTTPLTGKANPGVYQFLSNFEDERNQLHRGGWYWNTESEIFVMNDGNHVEKVRMNPWARNFGYMSFSKNTTYVLSFDVYGVSNGDGTPIDSDRALRAYTQTYNLKEAADNRAQFSYKNAEGNVIGELKIVPNEWTHYTTEATVKASNTNLFSFQLNADKETIFYIDNLTIVKKTDCAEAGHTAGIWKADSLKTCTTDGHSELLCAVCGTQMDEKNEPKGHVKSSEQTIITAATCTTDGAYEYKCVICNEKVEEGVIAKLGHTPGAWEETKAADCHETGSELCKCTVCGETISTRDIPKLNHIESKWTVDVEAAPGVEGHRYKKCTVCGDVVREEKIAALPVETNDDTATETSGNDQTKNDGCQSTVGGFSMLAILMAAGVMIKRKKH